jgi:hypothetical protein
MRNWVAEPSWVRGYDNIPLDDLSMPVLVTCGTQAVWMDACYAVDSLKA